jgi:hypothetical protein
MGNNKLIDMAAEAAYNQICDRAMKMVEEAFGSSVNPTQRLLLETGISAGVTAAIQTFGEAGLFKTAEG